MNFNFNRLPPFKWFVLQNFPFIEADFDSITYYQLLCKLAEELNKIITQNNQIGVQVENLTNAYNQLQEYINNYLEDNRVPNFNYGQLNREIEFINAQKCTINKQILQFDKCNKKNRRKTNLNFWR